MINSLRLAPEWFERHRKRQEETGFVLRFLFRFSGHHKSFVPYFRPLSSNPSSIMNPTRNYPPHYTYRTRRAEQDTDYNATGTHSYENDNTLRYTSPPDIYCRIGRNDPLTTVSRLTNNYQRDTSVPNTFDPIGVYRLESDNSTMDTPFINAWTPDGDQVIIRRGVVDTVGLGITRTVVCTSLRNGRTIITVLARPPSHPTRPARIDKLSPSGLILHILTSLSVVFGTFCITYAYGFPFPRLLSQYLTNGAHFGELSLVANSTGLDYTFQDIAFSFFFLLTIAIFVIRITSKN
ncbi:hypothetical protein K435DRAFT_798230 [Dendrothele bispora CBS 962.96]|uniref:Uncharacterized protein n=1 Tax=Dendrothele bispora (strain CBS 962.96) TaxID=1314807 RepID=A0A4S8M138_DENBC|nr:hypothetical protein K435DRAFT_798230 [Dendrothele bispora CBS 962.96]